MPARLDRATRYRWFESGFLQRGVTSELAIGEMIWIIADGPLHSSQSQIAFPSREQLSLLIEEAGLEVERWMSDWSGAPRSPQAAEIIPLGRLR